MPSETRIDEPEIERDVRGNVNAVRFAFGPHYFVQVDIRDQKVTLALGATHHGISADASQVNGELEVLIEELKKMHPEKAF